mgnify:CR=1 FL=1|jgi:hypothetical protein
MKTFLTAAVVAGFGLGLAGGASATELLTNGNFSAGNTGFQSEYDYLTLNGFQTNLWPEGAYDVSMDPNSDHYLFSSFPDHTGDAAGLMMVVNGSGVPDKVVWSQGQTNLGGTALIGAANVAYTFSFYLASVYPASPANMQLWINEVAVPSATIAGTGTPGQWQHFTFSGVSGVDGIKSISLSNKNLEPSGNDFALDDFSLTSTAVPEPASWALMILGFGGIGAMVRNRRRVLAAV